ncbi:MAG TPA: PIN domain-containing protein, partial [Methylobacterium sp.]
MTATKTIFVDTNAFLQLRDLADLPWRELLPGADHVAIMVARPVVEELDGFKTSTRTRLRDRSRRALALIDEAAEADGRTKVLKERPVRVTLTIAPRRRPDWSGYPELDVASRDDRLVVAAAGFGAGAELLSHDSGPRLSAKEIGLKAHAPPSSWLLPEPQSDESRRLAQAERDLKAALDRRPAVRISFPDAVDGVILHVAPSLAPLAAVIRDRLVGRVLAENPPYRLRAESLRSFSYGTSMGGVSEHQIESYMEEYETYRAAVASYCETLHERVAQVAQVAQLPRIAFEVENVGSVSVMQLVVGIASADYGLLPDSRGIVSVAGSTALPDAPERPLDRLQEQMRSFSTHSMLSAAPHRINPVEMRWHDRPSLGGDEGSYGCEDFRPGRAFRDLIGL